MLVSSLYIVCMYVRLINTKVREERVELLLLRLLSREWWGRVIRNCLWSSCILNYRNHHISVKVDIFGQTTLIRCLVFILLCLILFTVSPNSFGGYFYSRRNNESLWKSFHHVFQNIFYFFFANYYGIFFLFYVGILWAVLKKSPEVARGTKLRVC